VTDDICENDIESDTIDERCVPFSELASANSSATWEVTIQIGRTTLTCWRNSKLC